MREVSERTALHTDVEAFLRFYPETQVAVVEEPLLERVPVQTLSPFLTQFDAAPVLKSFGRSTHASVIQATRSARLDGMTRLPVVLFGQHFHLTIVSIVGEPYLLLLLHPTEGIGPVTAPTDSSSVTVFRGICDSQMRLLALDDCLLYTSPSPRDA